MLSIAKAVTAFFAFLRGLLDWKQRADAERAGRNAVELEKSQEANAAKDRELEAVINAPTTVSEAIKRLEEGSA